MTKPIDPNQLYNKIASIIEESRRGVFKSINTAMVQSYWLIGKEIVEEEQKGKDKADYGKSLIESLSIKLSKDFGKGFSARNLWNMRRFYVVYEKMQAVPAELSWTHINLLLRIDEELKRSFYEVETVKNNWSTRELERQINSMLFERVALSKDRDGVKKLAREGQQFAKPEDLVKEPYVFEFLDIPEPYKISESDLESGIIEHLQQFLLELGKGFSFVARQKRISFDNKHFYIDLVFYNFILKCFVLIDLKTGELTHQDLGQMQMYVNYYTRELMNEGDIPPIGIVLCADKSEMVVKYTLPEDNKQIYASKYKLYLPTEEELKAEIMKDRELIEMYQSLKEDNND